MAKTTRNSSAVRRLQPADFPLPKRLSQKQFSEICEMSKISNRHAAELKDFLDKLVSHLHDWILKDKMANRKADRDHIIASRKRITKLRDELEWLGIDGTLAVQSTAARLADIVSGDWLRDYFGGPSRTTRVVPRSTRDPDRELRNWENRSNYYFIRGRAHETLQALLRDLDTVLASAQASLDSDSRARGGQRRLEHRHSAIVYLAKFWRDPIGKTPVGTPGSDFAIFCKSVFEAWEWPTNGLNRAIPKALE